MIPRIRIPQRAHGGETSAFARGPSERRLRVVVDESSLPDDDDTRHLLGFQHHPSLEVVTVDGLGQRTLEFEPRDSAADIAGFIVRSPTESHSMAVVGAHQLRRYAAEDAMKGAGDEGANLESLILAMACREYGCDAFVTNREYILSAVDSHIVRPSNPMVTREALALVGLFLRSRDDFTYRQEERASGRTNRGLFYWVVARDLLPSAWRWFSACVVNMAATGDETAEHLAESTIAAQRGAEAAEAERSRWRRGRKRDPLRG
jgi:hypothetical protein